MITGALAGRNIKPVQAFSAGAVSHALMDAIPHRDYQPRPLPLALDLATGSALVATACGTNMSAWAGALGAITPDVLQSLPFLGPAYHGSRRAHQVFHTKQRISNRPVAVASQIALAGAALYGAWWLHQRSERADREDYLEAQRERLRAMMQDPELRAAVATSSPATPPLPPPLPPTVT